MYGRPAGRSGGLVVLVLVVLVARCCWPVLVWSPLVLLVWSCSSPRAGCFFLGLAWSGLVWSSSLFFFFFSRVSDVLFFRVRLVVRGCVCMSWFCIGLV